MALSFEIGQAVRVASYHDYRQVERAMAALARADFPMRRAIVIGRDYRPAGSDDTWVGLGRVAVLGGFALAWLGGMLAVAVGFVGGLPPERLGMTLLWGIVLGGVVGALVLPPAQMLAAGRRPRLGDRIVAGAYDITVAEPVAELAKRTLSDRRLVEQTRLTARMDVATRRLRGASARPARPARP